MIRYMVQHFPDEEMQFYVYDRRSEEELPDLENVHRILSAREFLLNAELRHNVRRADKIIASGIFTIQFFLPLLGRGAMRKTLLQYWGGRLCRLPERRWQSVPSDEPGAKPILPA